jgi:hypothetical protein
VEGASERSILSSALAKHRVHDLSVAEAEREKRKDKDNNKIFQKYGEIYVHQGRTDIEEDDADDLRVINMRNQRLAKPWKVKYKKVMEQYKEGHWDVFSLKPTDHKLW